MIYAILIQLPFSRICVCASATLNHSMARSRDPFSSSHSPDFMKFSATAVDEQSCFLFEVFP